MGSNVTLSIAYLFLLITSGLALKHVYENATLSKMAFSMMLLTSLLCCLRFTHPHASKILHRICVHATYFAQQVAPALIIADALKLADQLCLTWWYITIGINGLVLLTQWPTKRRSLNNWACNAAIIWNIASLIYIVFIYNSSYWTIGLIFLLLLNHFVLLRLALYYEITHLEITIVGLCFFVTFAQKTITELEGSASWSKNFNN